MHPHRLWAICHAWKQMLQTVGLLVAASRMVDHWISSQRAESGTSSPVRDATSSPSPTKKRLTIQTVVPDKPQPIRKQKTLSERWVMALHATCLFYSPHLLMFYNALL